MQKKVDAAMAMAQLSRPAVEIPSAQASLTKQSHPQRHVDIGQELMLTLRDRARDLDAETQREIPRDGTLIAADLLWHLAMYFDLNAADAFSESLQEKVLKATG